MYLLIIIVFIAGGFFLLNTKSGKELSASLSQTALDLVSRLEGYSSTVYRDVAGFLTIGFGHKLKPGEEYTTITREQAEALLAQDMQDAINVVNQYVHVPLTENQHAALVSFVFNTASRDPERFANSTLLKKLNAGDYQGAAEEMSRWVYAGGEKVRGLIARRETEKTLFLT